MVALGMGHKSISISGTILALDLADDYINVSFRKSLSFIPIFGYFYTMYVKFE